MVSGTPAHHSKLEAKHLTEVKAKAEPRELATASKVLSTILATRLTKDKTPEETTRRIIHLPASQPRLLVIINSTTRRTKQWATPKAKV